MLISLGIIIYITLFKSRINTINMLYLFCEGDRMKSRIIRTNITLNTRDLGNLKTSDNKKTKLKRFIRSDNLVYNHDSIYTIIDLMENYNLKHVIDLRASLEVEKDKSSASKIKGITYNNISLVNFIPLGNGIPNEYNYKELYQWYIDILEKSKKEIKDILECIYKNNKGATLFNCTMGKDRTTIIAMILLLIARVDKKTIAKDHSISEQNVISIYAPYLHSMNDNQKVFTKVKYNDIIQTINYIENNYKNIDNYLLSCNIDKKIIISIRRRFVS